MSDTKDDQEHEQPEHVPASRVGLALFAFYLALYLGFVLTAAFRPDAMEWIVGLGLNLAIVYGFLLILAAIALALIYGVASRAETDVKSGESQELRTATSQPEEVAP
ncbi:MAG: DUF485 domain-containing protein [Planctomycetota bacterium]